MFGILRRTSGLTVCSILVWLAAKHGWLNHSFGSVIKVLSLVGIVLALAIVILAIVRPHGALSFLSFLVGIGFAYWVANEFSANTTIRLLVIAATAVALWLWVVPDFSSFGMRFIRRGARTRSTSYDDD